MVTKKWRWEKHKKGGWIVFLKTFLSHKNNNYSQVQSLIEFRVLVQRIESKSAENERRTQAIYTGSFYNPEVVLSPLRFQREFH